MRRNERTTLILVRHGECAGNVEGRFRGRVDFPLNPRGREQAAACAKAMVRMSPSVVYTSPLVRAFDTAAAIAAACSIPVVPEERLNNMSLGEWENRKKDEIAREFPDQWNLWMQHPESLRVPGAETLDEVMRRSVECVNELVARHRGDTIAVTSHRTVLKPMIAGLLGIRSPWFWKVHMDTASISVILHEERRGYMIHRLNDTSHLDSFETEWV